MGVSSIRQTAIQVNEEMRWKTIGEVYISIRTIECFQPRSHALTMMTAN